RDRALRGDQPPRRFDRRRVEAVALSVPRAAAFVSARHTVEIQVRWSESDPAGIAFYPRFFEWFDIACAALFDSLALPWPVLFPQYSIVGVPIVECGSRFSSPVRYGDTMEVTATVAWVKDKTFRVEYAVAVD